ncbi:transcription elongation factor A N-terminal and central domain-containing protein [Protopterus annectens]|uniref:transcription elongation factor A N-terminal and central domain-containing protein n=1 Tax=Protopterus annectens TaxID=7888 RepID=UPI001CFA43A9|nr:transcription elongation factor A N-terminal and central domain-containing protein [Protopterus annectens]XP_043928469.1 transcription elongation factor A N-terminal and central domain-containing protein [Protopterus annectens]
MADTKVVVYRAHQIEKCLAENRYQDISILLDDLSNLCMTNDQLQETDIARATYLILKKCPSTTLRTKAKKLLSAWKQLYKKRIQHSSPAKHEEELSEQLDHSREGLCDIPVCGQFEESGAFLSSSSECALTASLSVEKYAVQCSVKNNSSHIGPVNQLNETDGAKTAPGEDSHLPVPEQENMRSKCTEILFKALINADTASDATSDMCHILAKEVEEHIFALHSKNDRKYKACIRCKVSNLKNPKTPHLRLNLLSGALSPKSFSEMSVMEMASDELKMLRASIAKTCVNEHQLPQGVEGSKTNKIMCKRCEQFNCTVTLISRGTLFLPAWVRSGTPDEQMMTFVICNECGQKWYNSGWISF